MLSNILIKAPMLHFIDCSFTNKVYNSAVSDNNCIFCQVNFDYSFGHDYTNITVKNCDIDGLFNNILASLKSFFSFLLDKNFMKIPHKII